MLEEVKNQGRKDGGMENAAEQGAAEGENAQQNTGNNNNNNNTQNRNADKKNSTNPKVQLNYQTAIIHRAITKISKIISKVFGNNGK